jgi:16S rRNA processing protein RimM
VTDRNAAEALKGARIVPRSAFPVRQRPRVLLGRPDRSDRVNREGVHLGVVRDLCPPARIRCWCWSRNEGEQPHRAPDSFCVGYVDKVDLAAGRITVDWQPDY